MIKGLEIKRVTEKLRDGGEPLWVRIRQLLLEKGIDPEGSVLAYFAPEEAQYEFGVIVTDKDEVIQFAFDYLQKGVMGGVFGEWENVSGRLKEKPYRKEVEEAFWVKEKMKEGQ